MSSDATASGMPGQSVAQPGTQKPAGPGRALPTVLIGSAFLLFLLFAGLIAWISGRVTGEEFDALSWSVRSFAYTRNPFTGGQFTGVLNDTTSRFTIDPVILPFVTGGPIAPKTARWDLIDIQRASQYGIGDAKILLEYLRALDTDQNNYWTVWTQKNPLAAPVLWTAVRDCVHLPRYDRLPDLFEKARVQTNPQRLKADIAKIMVSIASEEARSLAAAGQKSEAARAAQLGLMYGQNDELKQLAKP
ncbi:MAG: hypothetical protein IT423_00975 [Pirellulaceae bacterium]|nr:hypothetical protein [Pirellulaceae bacterium]